jgi:ABC-type dipeptide/oligopeptide/nickel transport system permease subunit
MAAQGRRSKLRTFYDTHPDFYRDDAWMILFPGITSLAVFGFSLFGDSLRDYLDPRFKT